MRKSSSDQLFFHSTVAIFVYFVNLFRPTQFFINYTTLHKSTMSRYTEKEVYDILFNDEESDDEELDPGLDQSGSDEEAVYDPALDFDRHSEKWVFLISNVDCVFEAKF